MRSDPAADWLSLPEARDAVLGSVIPLRTVSRPLLAALDAVLAEEIVSPLDLPPWDNSAMDGFAVRSADTEGASADAPIELRVVDDIAAGGRPSRPLQGGEASRVMTGAPVPDGADGVIRVEHTDGGSGLGSASARVRVVSDTDAFRNIRRRGEDLREGQRVLERGTLLGPAELAVAASLGRERLEVVRAPRVAILATGDELVPVEQFAEVIAGRRIVSSNSYALAAQVRAAGAEPVDLGIAPDDPAAIRERVEAAQGCDALVTTAGVSVGEHDHLKRVLREAGAEVAFWRVRIRPGSPFAFGRIEALGGIPWFGLPGNPVSTMVTFEVLVRPALLRLAGRSAVFHPTRRARLRAEFAGPRTLTHLLRVRLEAREDGGLAASLTGPQGSGVLSSMLGADALLVVPEAAPVDADIFTALLLNAAPLQAEPGY